MATKTLCTNSQQDLLLTARIANGQESALQSLTIRFGEAIRLYALKLTCCPATADEVLNDVLMEVWQNAGNFRGDSKLSTWLLGITRNVALNTMRRAPPRVVSIEIDRASEELDGMSTSGEAERALEEQHLSDCIQAGLERLNREQRDIVDLCYLQERPCDEVAFVVGCPTATVRTRLFYARKQLRRTLASQRELLCS